MSLTGAQETSLAAIIYEPPSVVSGLTDDLDADIESFVIERLTAYGLIRDSHVKLKGGKDGVDFDNERKRAAIRIELRIVLGLDPVSAVDPGYQNMSIFELEVGSNFG